MIHVENIEVLGIKQAIHGMRQPMQSHYRDDSETYKGEYYVGLDNTELAVKLIKGGSEHRKFLRMIQVYMDVTAPLYWWSQFDTYKVGTVANSTSKMHTLHKNPITLDMFSVPPKMDDFDIEYMKNVVSKIEEYRIKFVETKQKEYWHNMIALLPSSFNQTRTLMFNYEVVLNIMKQRAGHKLQEWQDFVKVLWSLPYAKEFFA